jgi:PPK2 family polyphosphate:nucleotide phosphotransferase
LFKIAVKIGIKAFLPHEGKNNPLDVLGFCVQSPFAGAVRTRHKDMASKEIDPIRYRLPLGKPADLSMCDPAENGGWDGKGDVAKRLEACRDRMRELQEQMYAEGRQSVLVCLQGMDTAGKDGVINRVFNAINPMGCHVTSFKVPSQSERSHDFLWRHHVATPAAGMIALHNRSHYEAVVTERVLGIVDTETTQRRYEDINAFENLLSHSGTTLLKFYLHISKDEQLDRLKARLDDPLKYWKLSIGDFEQRQKWNDHMTAYNDAITATNTVNAPWFIVPSNYKWFRDLVIAEITVEALEKLTIAKPKVPSNMDELRERYLAELQQSKVGIKLEKAEVKSKRT